MELGGAGDAITGGLIGAAIEKPTGHAGEAHHVCSDCGAETSGRFCSNCGQPTHVHRTLLHLGEELLHGVMHFDSRVWRTLPLLMFRPGRLTREWVHGRRTRYVSPLAMFLFTVFVMFMMLSYMPVSGLPNVADQRTAVHAEVGRQVSAVAAAERRLSQAKTSEARAIAEDDLTSARKDLVKAQKEVANFNMAMRDLQLDEGKTWQQQLSEDVKSGEFKVNSGNKKLDEKILHKLENPDLALYKLQQTFYKFSFLLVPLSIPFVALLFVWKRGFTLYDHGVFVLYSLTFMSMLGMAVFLAAKIGAPAMSLATSAVTFIVPTHMYFQLKGAYGLNWFSALWRTVWLLVFCAVVVALFVLAVVMLGMG